MPKGSPGKDSSENIQLEPLSRTPRRNESIDPEIDAKAPLRHAARKCDLGTCNILCFFKFLLHIAKYVYWIRIALCKNIWNAIQSIER